MRKVVIVAGARTPIGAFGGSLKSTPVVQLGTLVLKETLKKAGLRPVATTELTRFEPEALKGMEHRGAGKGSLRLSGILSTGAG